MKIYKSKKYFTNTKKSKHNKKGGSNSSQMCLYNEDKGTMEGECPGVRHFNEIKNSIVIDPDAVYTVVGHACDILNDIQDIPAGCQYITAVACGYAKSSDKGVREKDLWSDFLNNTLNRSINEQSLITKYNRFSENRSARESWTDHQYRIQTEGHQFVNSRNWCFLDFGELAGLRKLGHITPPIPSLNNEEGTVQKYTMRAYFLMHFEGSLYPTCKQVNDFLENHFSLDELNSHNYYFDSDTLMLKNMNKSSEDPLTEEDENFNNFKYADKFENIVKDYFLIDFGTLMLNLKGTFINNACRTLCGKFGTTNYDIDGTHDAVRDSRARERRT